MAGKGATAVGGDKNLAASSNTVAGGKGGSRLTLISARGPAGSDRSNLKLDGSVAEDLEKYVRRAFYLQRKNVSYSQEENFEN